MKSTERKMTVERTACACSSIAHDTRYEKLDAIIAKHKDRRGALIPILHEAQELFGCLSEDIQDRIAKGLGIPLSEVYGVTTFYSLFTLKPRGKWTIAVCMGTACYVRGAAEVLNALKTELGVPVNGTTDDGRFTLEVVRCLGACGLAPVMTIGGDVYGRMRPEKIRSILDSYG